MMPFTRMPYVDDLQESQLQSRIEVYQVQLLLVLPLRPFVVCVQQLQDYTWRHRFECDMQYQGRLALYRWTAMFEFLNTLNLCSEVHLITSRARGCC